MHPNHKTEAEKPGRGGALTGLLLGVLTGVLLAGCESQPPAAHFDPRASSFDATHAAEISVPGRIDSEDLLPPTNLFTLGPGDRLQIELMEDPTTRTIVPVEPDGRVHFYLLSGVDVWGLTLAQAQQKLENAMTNYVRDNPKLVMSLRGVDSQRVWLLGRLNAPGTYPLTGPMTLLEAISLAGGPASVGAQASIGGSTLTLDLSGTTQSAADLRRSFVMRQGRLLPVDFQRLLKDGDTSQNIYLQPDDLVYLPSAQEREIHILGAVAQPKAVSYMDGLTLISTITAAGGTIKNAYLSHVAIVRGSLAQPKIAIVDYKDIVTGKAPDVLLEPQDIVYVPFSPYRVLTRYVDLILDTFVRTVGANEGALVVSPNAAAIGINVPVGATVTPSLGP